MMEEKRIEIMDIVNLAWRRLWLIALAFVICAGVAFGYCSLLVTPRYSATASILVTNGAITSVTEDKNTVSATDVSASLYLANTITDILKTPDIYKRVADEMGKGYSYQGLMGGTSVARRGDNTLFIDVSFSSTDPKEAMRVANKFVEISCDYITEFIPYSKASVASTAIKASMTYPRTLVTTAASGIAGAAIVFVVVFIIEILNRSIKGEEDFTSRFNIPLLGAVPDFENAEINGYKKGKGGYGSGY